MINKTGTHPHTIVETGSTQPSLKTKAKHKRITGSLPLFKTDTYDSKSETDSLSVHSKCSDNVLKRKISQNPNLGVYQDDTVGSFKIERLSFKYNDKHVFVGGK